LVAWGQPDSAATRAFYRAVLHLVLSDSAFAAGDFRPVETNAGEDVIAYARGGALVLVNTRSHGVAVLVTGFAVNGARDRLTDRAQAGDTVALAPYGAVVLER